MKNAYSGIPVVLRLFALLGFVCLIFFITDLKPKYNIYISDPDEDRLILMVKNYWGLQRRDYPLRYGEYGWEYQEIESVKKSEDGSKTIQYGKWRSVPETKGVYDPEYIRNINSSEAEAN